MVMNFAAYLWDFLVAAFIIFLFVMWIWLLITTFGDLFRRRDMGAFGKVLWFIFLLFLPYLGVFLYLLTQSRGMAQRDVDRAMEARDHLRATIGFSVADELKKLDQLKADGKISDAEYKELRARLI